MTETGLDVSFQMQFSIQLIGTQWSCSVHQPFAADCESKFEPAGVCSESELCVFTTKITGLWLF